ncbi:sensor histidine kinase [Neolewinella persica]|uniref:sensor histidine kinase n=1 Tax=Neolewinella persica TaxID=70998 RepID=UPI000370C258|nr:sensor histidine kinase [Neolewinella persica]
MQAALSNFADFLQRTTTWLFLTVILSFSYALTQATDSGSLVVYFRFAASLTMISAPVLIYSLLGLKHGSRANKTAVAVVFGLFTCGILLYNPAIQSLPFTRYQLEADSFSNLQSVRLLFAAFILLQGLLWWQHRWATATPFSGWLRKLNGFWLAVAVVAVFCAGLTTMSNAFQDATAGLSPGQVVSLYLLVVVQAFLVYFPYYLIYHVHHHYLFRGLLQKRGLLYYLLGAIALLLVFTPIHATLAAMVPAVRTYEIHPAGFVEGAVNDINLSLSFGIFLFSLPLIIIVEWSRKERALSQLRTEQATTELALLKEQINPHFFFNTLNNLYAMSLTREANTPETILKLSGLMRFVIYKGKENFVKLKDEVGYLQDYLDLQSLRLHKEADLQFTKVIGNAELPIAPMLLITLLENAFKHGVEPAEEACFLHAHLEVSEDAIIFSCHNSRPPDLPPVPPGIGLQNLRRRLELLYHERHELSLRETATDYHASLIIRP